MKCAKCGYENSIIAGKCLRCGEPLKMDCSNCNGCRHKCGDRKGGSGVEKRNHK